MRTPELKGRIAPWMTGLLLAVMTLTFPSAVSADVEDELTALREEVEVIKRELTAIKLLLTKHVRTRGQLSSQEPVTIAVAGRPTLGHPDAPVTIVEFTDYQCPYCMRFAKQTFPLLKTNYIDTGKVRYVLRDFPLTNIHPEAAIAAQAAHCAGQKDQYWTMHDRLFEKRGRLSVTSIKEIAESLGLEAQGFADCLDSGRFASQIERDKLDGLKAGVRGTPTFFIGPSRPGDSIAGRPIVGAKKFAAFKALIEGELEKIAGIN